MKEANDWRLQTLGIREENLPMGHIVKSWTSHAYDYDYAYD